MRLASNKTQFVYAIGPASESPDILRQKLHAGMNIACLNFSHGIKRRSTPCLLAVSKPVGDILFINDGVIQPLHHRTGAAKNPFLQKAYASRCDIWSRGYCVLLYVGMYEKKLFAYVVCVRKKETRGNCN